MTLCRIGGRTIVDVRVSPVITLVLSCFPFGVTRLPTGEDLRAIFFIVDKSATKNIQLMSYSGRPFVLGAVVSVKIIAKQINRRIWSVGKY